MDVYCTGTTLCELLVLSKYSWHVCIWCTLSEGGAMLSARNETDEQRRYEYIYCIYVRVCVRVCECVSVRSVQVGVF